MSNSPRCAACKSLRRKCPKDCVLAPYFPPHNPQRFALVHQVFGASNITKMLKQLPMNQRKEAAECMSFEAASRVKDPVYGCAGVVTQLEQQITEVQLEIVKTRGEIALFHAQHQQQQEDHHQVAVTNFGGGGIEQDGPSYFFGGPNQEDPLFMDQPPAPPRGNNSAHSNYFFY